MSSHYKTIEIHEIIVTLIKDESRLRDVLIMAFPAGEGLPAQMLYFNGAGAIKDLANLLKEYAHD